MGSLEFQEIQSHDVSTKLLEMYGKLGIDTCAYLFGTENVKGPLILKELCEQ